MAPMRPLNSKKKDKNLVEIEKPNGDKKKKKKRSYRSFSIYIYKLLRTLNEENFGISRNSMLIMNNFVNDMFERISNEARNLTTHSKKTTLGSREIQSAVKLLIPGELGKHSNMEGMKAVRIYESKKSSE